ncbi:MAG: nuclear transport factor 2 family protein, partial [Flavobacteriales bacterium]|nr:nuclear transport factor 2 family protein [Flavobacteriales bacterium]
KSNKDRVRRFFYLLSEENINEFVEMFSEQGEEINPYSSGMFPPGAKGTQALKDYWKPVPENFEGMEFDIQQLLQTEDPNVVFVKYQGKIKLKNDQGYYHNQYYSTFTFDEEGKILEYVEIFNPIVAAKAFGLTPLKTDS